MPKNKRNAEQISIRAEKKNFLKAVGRAARWVVYGLIDGLSEDSRKGILYLADTLSAKGL